MIQLDHNRIDIPVLMSKCLNGYVGREIQIGIRPNDIRNAKMPSEKNTFTVNVDIVEMMGDELYVYFEFEGCDMVGKFPAATDAQATGTICFGINASKNRNQYIIYTRFKKV